MKRQLNGSPRRCKWCGLDIHWDNVDEMWRHRPDVGGDRWGYCDYAANKRELDSLNRAEPNLEEYVVDEVLNKYQDEI